MIDPVPLARVLADWILARAGDAADFAAADAEAYAPAGAAAVLGDLLQRSGAAAQGPGLRLGAMLVALPRLFPTPARPRPGTWWRQATCAAMVAARLRPSEGHLAALAAALAGAAPILLSNAMPLAWPRAAAHSAGAGAPPSPMPLWRTLSSADPSLRLGELAAGAARAWGADARVGQALRALDDDRALEADPLAAAVVVARWLLALKGMRAPGEAGEPEPSARTIARLGLGASGLAEAIADLGSATDSGRALCESALACAARGAPRRMRRALS